MTLNQLQKEVYALGFDEPDCIGEDFVFCVNRALKIIFTEFSLPIREEIKVSENDAKVFNLNERVKNPLIIISAPTDSSGKTINGAYTDGYTVTLPETFVGSVFILYKAMPEEVSLDSGDDEIEIPPYASHLLALLCASFVLLDDEPEKAEYYMSIYQSEANKLRRLYSLSKSNTYTDVTGWA